MWRFKSTERFIFSMKLLSKDIETIHAWSPRDVSRPLELRPEGIREKKFARPGHKDKHFRKRALQVIYIPYQTNTKEITILNDIPKLESKYVKIKHATGLYQSITVFRSVHFKTTQLKTSYFISMVTSWFTKQCLCTYFTISNQIIIQKYPLHNSLVS